jgi:branched-chain amino acid transport system ATP-binding protein
MRLSLEGVNCYYGDVHVLRDVSLACAAGEIVCLLGRNGAGKTTTLRAVMGLVPLRSGSIRLDGHDLARLSPPDIPRRGIGYVPQGRRLFPFLTVAENLRMGLLLTRQGEESLRWVLDLFPVLRERLGQRAGTLSGGQQQMLATARALCAQPGFLLMDEPSEGLQPSLVQRLLETIRTLKARQVGVLLVEQKIEVALKVADRVVVMENGSVGYAGTPQDLASRPEVMLRYLGVRR